MVMLRGSFLGSQTRDWWVAYKRRTKVVRKPMVGQVRQRMNSTFFSIFIAEKALAFLIADVAACLAPAAPH